MFNNLSKVGRKSNESLTERHEFTNKDEWKVVKNVVLLACIQPNNHGKQFLNFFGYHFKKISQSCNQHFGGVK
jgi:hypothetical protein